MTDIRDIMTDIINHFGHAVITRSTKSKIGDKVHASTVNRETLVHPFIITAQATKEEYITQQEYCILKGYWGDDYWISDYFYRIETD